MRMKFIIGLLSLAISVAVLLIWIKKHHIPDTVPDSSIKTAIQTFQSLVDAQNYKELGLKNERELISLKPGIQFKNFMITIDKVKQFKTGEDVQKMIKEYPSMEVSLVDSSGNIRTSIEFVKEGDKWLAVAYGSTPDLVLLSKAQKRIPASIIMHGRLIRMPSFELCFFAMPSAGNMTFYLLSDKPDWTMQMGDTLSAEAVMLKLVPIAHQHYGAP